MDGRIHCSRANKGFQAFTAVHIAAIVATLWILMLNGIVGYQLLDDGTPLSLGLMIVSAAIIFIGTGYIALDTGFSWTGYWDSTLTGNNRAYALYTLYQLAPLVFLVVFFFLEAILVIRILGERKPLSKPHECVRTERRLTIFSVPHRRSPLLRHRPNIPVRRQRPYLQRHRRQDQRRPILDALHPPLRRNSLGLLVQHHRRRLAHADRRRSGRILALAPLSPS